MKIKNLKNKIRKLDAFLYDAVILDYRSGQDDGCKLRVVGSWYAMTAYGIALPKGSKYKEMIDRKILEYSHSGELERTQKFWFTGTCNNMEEMTNTKSHQFGLLQSSSVFILLLAGIIIGILLLLAHRFFRKYIGNRFENVWFYEKSDKFSKVNSQIYRNFDKSIVSKKIYLNMSNPLVLNTGFTVIVQNNLIIINDKIFSKYFK